MELIFPRGIIKEKFAFTVKLAVVSALAVIAVVVSLTSRQPNTVKTISNELLDWEGAKITTQIDELKNQFQSMQEDNWEKDMLQFNQKLKKSKKSFQKHIMIST